MMNMRILIVGSNKHMSIERHYERYLREQGADVSIFASGDMVYDFHSANIFNKILFKTGIWTTYKKVNQALINAATSFKPDIIWVFKGMEIFPDTLQKLRQDFILVNYNPDHPFIISGRGSGNKNVTNSVGLYHLHFCYHTGLQKTIEDQYHLPTVFLPFGFELSEKDYIQACNAEEVKKVCFLGNPDSIRERMVAFVAQSGFAIDVFGHGWNKSEVRHITNVSVHDAVYGSEFWLKLRSYRVQLNIFRPHNVESHNMRTFEIPAVGGIQLAPHSEEQASFFTSDEEIFFYKNDAELLQQLRELMSLSESEASLIRTQARDKSVQSNYTYANRAAICFQAFKSIIN